MPAIKKTNAIQKRMWAYRTTEEDMEAVKYCFENAIHISPIGIQNDLQNFYIDIVIRGKRNLSKKTYPLDEVVPKMYEFYKYYYNKRNKS